MIKKLSAALLLSGFALANANAATIALQWSGTGSDGFSSQTRGWAFSSNASINVTSLGWFDFANDGLADSHKVGVWDELGNLLMTGTVSAGNADPLLAGFRYTSALSGTTTLAAGSYVVAGLSTDADRSWRNVSPAAVTTGPEISFIEDRTSGTTVFEYADFHQGFDVGYFGANFQYNTVPEPAALPLCLLGLGLLGVATRARRRSKAA